MCQFSWKFGNFDEVLGLPKSYNTLYVDMAKLHTNGLIFLKGSTVAGFISLDKKISLFGNVLYASKTGVLLTDLTLYTEAFNQLKRFTHSQRLTIFSPIDYMYNYKGQLNNFIGSKQTIINPLVLNPDMWLAQIKKKHRYYVRKGLKNNHQCYTQPIKDMKSSEINGLYRIYVEQMRLKGADLLFATESEFCEFVDRNPKSIIVTTCYKDGQLGYFNIVHTNNNIANYIMAVTTKLGMGSYASYIGIFELYKYIQKNKFTDLNFGGIDPLNNHGVYLFKKGFSGELISSPKYMVVGTKITESFFTIVLKIRVLVNKVLT